MEYGIVNTALPAGALLLFGGGVVPPSAAGELRSAYPRWAHGTDKEGHKCPADGLEVHV